MYLCMFLINSTFEVHQSTFYDSSLQIFETVCVAAAAFLYGYTVTGSWLVQQIGNVPPPPTHEAHTAPCQAQALPWP